VITKILLTRRCLLAGGALAVALTPLALATPRTATAADLPLLSPAEPAAKKVKYVENAKQAPNASAGSSCANCGLYQGAAKSDHGPCQIFPGKAVKAAGWCSSWAPQM
jgi:hypothetical protein